MPTRTGWTAKAAGVAVGVALLGTLSACGEQSPYCQTVQDEEQVLNSIGSSKTTESFNRDAGALSDISEVAPAESKEQWAAIAAAIQGVLQAHDDVGFALDDMADADQRASLSESDTAVIERAYDSFNDTAAAREAVIKNVKSSCDIELK